MIEGTRTKHKITYRWVVNAMDRQTISWQVALWVDNACFHIPFILIIISFFITPSFYDRFYIRKELVYIVILMLIDLTLVWGISFFMSSGAC